VVTTLVAVRNLFACRTSVAVTRTAVAVKACGFVMPPAGGGIENQPSLATSCG
jgi:hypothetical protein